MEQNNEFCKFIRDLAVSLHAENAFEAGCSAGDDLGLFNPKAMVCGIDIKQESIVAAKTKFPNWQFQVGSITNIPYQDAAFDFVFTHKVLNYLDDQDVEKAISELFRVSRRYIVNIELFGDSEKQKEGLTGRNVFNRWLNYKVKIISNVDMHEEIEPQQPRFTLVRKL